MLGNELCDDNSVSDGVRLCELEGCTLGAKLGTLVGDKDGFNDGVTEGTKLGVLEGVLLGNVDGFISDHSLYKSILTFSCLSFHLYYSIFYNLI